MDNKRSRVLYYTEHNGTNPSNTTYRKQDNMDLLRSNSIWNNDGCNRPIYVATKEQKKAIKQTKKTNKIISSKDYKRIKIRNLQQLFQTITIMGIVVRAVNYSKRDQIFALMVQHV